MLPPPSMLGTVVAACFIPTVLPPSLGPSIPHVTAVPPGRPAGRDKGAGEGGQQAAIEMLPDAVRRWQDRSRTSIPRLPAHRERGNLGEGDPGFLSQPSSRGVPWGRKAQKHLALQSKLACAEA